MPTTAIDHQDILGLQSSRPSQTDAATSGAPNMTAFSSSTLVNGSSSSDANGFSSSTDRERNEVEQQVGPPHLLMNLFGSNFTVQLEALKTQLEVENRVRDGAENLLGVPTLTVSVFTKPEDSFVLRR
jgi:hypothetical protein